MPKTLVLFHDIATAALADAVAEGARSVRFAEVDVRRVDDPALAQADAFAGYDGIVVGASPADGASAGAGAALEQAAGLGSHGGLRDRVGAAFTTMGEGAGVRLVAHWPAMLPMGRLGMILVPPTDAPSSAHGDEAVLAAARALGTRVATVVGWVRHAKGHEHGHAHAHGHSH